MKLRSKLISSFTGVASLILVIGLVGIVVSQQIIRSFEQILSSSTPAIAAIITAQADVTMMRESAISYVLSQQLGIENTDTDKFEAAKAEFDVSIAQYGALVENTRLYDEIVSAEAELYSVAAQLMALADANASDAEIATLIQPLEEAENRINAALDEAFTTSGTDFANQATNAGEVAANSQTIYFVSMVGVIAAAVVLSVLLARSILHPIQELQNVTSRMMQGDYSQRTKIRTRDEIGELATAFNAMAETVQKRDDDLNQINQTLERRIDDRTKELRIATREAQEASRLKDEFLSIMSHELRTPLNAIIGFQGILLMTGKLDERGKHMIQRAQANSNRLLTLINDILDISRIESGRLQLVKTEIDPTEIVERLKAQMSVLADEKQLDFSVTVGDSVPPVIHTDEDAITKIITNLLGNAFKFTDQGLVALRVNAEQDDLVIEVEDTGVGIPSHMHQVIFERFRQVDGSSKRAHGGSGLGLAIVQKLCLAMGGTIQVESTVGKGSTFRVVLPLEHMPERMMVS